PGTGKTTFGLVMSLYLSKYSEKSILIFPTKSLVEQAVDKLNQMTKKINYSPKIIYYFSGISESIKEEVNKAIENKDFDILLISSKFAINNKEKLKEINYSFLFVDDVDSVLKSSKSAYSILEIIGYNEEEIRKAKEFLRKSYREDTEGLKDLDEIRREKLKNKIVIFSSSTLTRGNPVISSLVGFRPGSSIIFIRNIIDAYTKLPEDQEEVFEILRKLLRKLGSGGLVFVPIDKGIEYAKEVERKLSDEFSIVTITSTSTSKIEKFKRGEIDLLVGVATHYGILVRGLDIPWRISYAIFLGIPKFKFKIGEIINPLLLIRLLSIISLIVKDEKLNRLLLNLRRKYKKLSPAALANIVRELKEGKIQDELINEGIKVLYEYLTNKEILKKVSQMNYFVITEDNYILTPDYLTYIQASGRTSRLFGGNLTTGLSILLVDDDNLFKILTNRLNLILDEVKWEKLDLENYTIGNYSLDEISKKLKEEREEIKKIRESGEVQSVASKIRTVLLIVESPTKAKTISSFFTKPTIKRIGNVIVYETIAAGKVLLVTASNGHLFDLTTKDIGLYGIEVIHKSPDIIEFIPYYNTIKRCSNGHQFTEETPDNSCPICGSKEISNKRDTIEVLKKLAIAVDEILIGTDPDVEGEKIAWDLYMVLRPFNKNIKRAEFHEVTRRAILEAINNPREISIPLVKSQIVRRVEDRWIGFKLSEKLQTEFWREYCTKISKDAINECKEINRNLSAGRVQTPVLGWVIKRYIDYRSTLSTYYIISLENSGIPFKVIVPKQKGLRKGSKVTIEIKDLQIVTEDITPLPPYTTDTLLQDSSNFYGMSAMETMRIAQDLFELGLITYHRTDSTRISNVGIGVAEQYLRQLLGEGYKKIFRPRTWGEGGAHEAIRPTRPIDSNQLRILVENGELELARELTFNHYKIYDLIFRRFITSQLSKLKIYKEKIEINIITEKDNIIQPEQNPIEIPVKVEIEGFENILHDKIYLNKKLSAPISEYINKQCSKLPCIVEGIITTSFKRSKYQLYTQGELIQEMKVRGIGRPSTYATIVSTLLKRGYVIETKALKKMIPTVLGINVYEYLTKNEKYSELVAEERTKKLLELMDDVEKGKEDYLNVLKRLYMEISKIE
ncbi:MAG: reverse gyrase, partial [Sulfolobaceae archaeon]